MKIKTLIILLTLSLRFVFSEIHTISTPYELTEYIVKNVSAKTLLVLDIDDTLLVAEDTILRAHLLDALLNEVANHFHSTQAEALGFVEFCLESSSERLGRGKLTFPELQPLIQSCFERQAKVIALTKVEGGCKKIYLPQLGIDYIRPIAGEDKRIEDLEQLGFNFESSFFEEFGVNSFEFSNNIGTFSKNNPPLFKKGILITNLHPKGEVLGVFLQTVSWKPAKVIFIDNLLANVESVNKKMKEMKIPFEGIHFNYVEQSLCKLDQKILDKQTESLVINKIWISEKSIHD